MRVVGGKFGSRALRSLRGAAVRPTSDRLRETLFNILGATVDGAVFVDLYAGTGAVGIEALSRGAAEVYFVEKQFAAAQLVQRNLASLGIDPVGKARMKPRRGLTLEVVREVPDAGSTEILIMDAVAGLRLLHRRHILADFVFLDPPYAQKEEYLRTLDAISDERLLAPAGRVVAESLRGGRDAWELPDRFGNLERTRMVEQGDSVLTFYRLALAA